MSTVDAVMKAGEHVTYREAEMKLESLLRSNYLARGMTRSAAKSDAISNLTAADKNALIEPVMDDFLRALDTELQLGVGSIAARNIRVKSGNTAQVSAGRADAIRKSNLEFEETTNKSFEGHVMTLLDIAKQPLYLAKGQWVTIGGATFDQLEAARKYSSQQATGHERTARKINEIQRLVLKARYAVRGEATLDKVIEFVYENGDRAEDIIGNLNVVALGVAA